MKNIRTALLLFVLIAFGQGAWAQNVGTATVDGGQATNWNTNESYDKLVDGDVNTKYGLSTADPWVEFHYTYAFTPTAYTLSTANDMEGQRNPKTWTIKAKNATDEEWVTLDEVDNSAGDKLPMANNTSTAFAINNTEAYQYYRFEATRNSTSEFQLAELMLFTISPIPNLEYATVSGVKSKYAWNNGNPVSITFTVTDAAGQTLTTDDYDVVFRLGEQLVDAVTEAGYYTMTITGKGNYSGSQSLSFKVYKPLAGNGTAASPYLIQNDEDWVTFAEAVDVKGYSASSYVQLAADINVTRPAGHSNDWNGVFYGNFNGCGHTITINLNSTEDYCAPFHLGQCELHNLRVVGTIHTSGRYAGGLAGWTCSSGQIYNCWSSVTIISSYQGEAFHSGLVAYNYIASGMTISNCLFDGKIITTNGTTKCAGMMGTFNQDLIVRNCLIAPAELEAGETACADNSTIYGKCYGSSTPSLSNNYYIVSQNMNVTQLQGTDASGLSPAELTQALGSAWRLVDGKPNPLIPIFTLLGSGTSSDPYLIRNAADWIGFGNNVRGGNTYEDKYFLMTADIDLGDDQTKIGTSQYSFAGHFDGGGYTLTVHYVSTGDYCAPFSYLKSNSHTFKNIHTAGTIQTNGRYAAGIIGTNSGYYGYVGTTTLEKCRSSVIITSTKEGEGVIGGLIAYHQSQLRVNNCLFDGSILGESTHTCSGLLGLNVGNSAIIANSLYNPQDQTVGETNSHTIGRSQSAYTSGFSYSNCYYTRTLGEVEGINGSQMTGAELVLALGAENWTLEDGQPVPRVAKPVDLNGSGTESDPYLIACEQDWNNLANNLEAGKSYQDKHFLQTADISILMMAGTADYPFNGIYDGDGHTLTFNAGTANAYQTQRHCAPFSYVKNATVKNLKIEGNIYTSAAYTAGLAAYMDGSFTVTNCQSNISITSSVNGDGTHGGFVARAMKGAATFTGCVFSGELIGTSTHSCGGFVGWTETNDGATAVFTDCLFAPQSCTFKGNNSKTFARIRNDQYLTLNNAYYLTQLGDGQGKLAHSISGEESITIALAGETTEYHDSGIIANGMGIEYNGMVLAGQGDNVSLILDGTAPMGYAVSGYVASAGTLTGTENPYTLAMPNADVTITALYGVAEWDGEGTENSPYLIYTTAQLDLLAERVNPYQSYSNNYFKLMADLDYDYTDLDPTESNYTPIGGASNVFRGHFDGNGHTISGIRIYKDGDDYLGVFGRIGSVNSEIKNLTLTDAVITGYTYVAGILGDKRDGTVTNCHVTSSVIIGSVIEGASWHGGIVGNNAGGEISHCTSAATFTVPENLDRCYWYGGIVGSNYISKYDCNVHDNFVVGTVIPAGTGQLGAIVGENQGILQRNYYIGCQVVGNTIGIGCDGADITTDDGAMPGNVRTVAAPNVWISDDPENYPIDGWAFIASPVMENLVPTNVPNLIGTQTAGWYDYDLYRFNPLAVEEWENYHQHTADFVLANGKGYLYAKQAGVTLTFNGTFNLSDTTEVTLQKGFNLVGNPFPRAAYIDKPYYTLNENGSAVPTTSAVSTATAILPCYGVIVQGTSNDETLTFTTTAPVASGSTNNGNLKLALTQAVATRGNTGTKTIDNAIVSFNEGEQLGKFYFGNQNANIYLPQGGKEYAIAYSEGQGEMPLNFKATKNGSYTITVNAEGLEMDYLHLIDNLTGADIDLMTTPSYSFEGKTDDYASRFKLVFSAVDNDNDNENFAFISNGEIIITGTGTLQLIDMLGHQLFSREATSDFRLPTSDFSNGVYVLRLINGENVKTQKIIVK